MALTHSRSPELVALKLGLVVPEKKRKKRERDEVLEKKRKKEKKEGVIEEQELKEKKKE